ncbi:MAG: hypothetical protein ACFFCS_15740 [Candidatus Hodarchaeota archaeon]
MMGVDFGSFEVLICIILLGVLAGIFYILISMEVQKFRQDANPTPSNSAIVQLPRPSSPPLDTYQERVASGIFGTISPLADTLPYWQDQYESYSKRNPCTFMANSYGIIELSAIKVSKAYIDLGAVNSLARERGKLEGYYSIPWEKDKYICQSCVKRVEILHPDPGKIYHCPACKLYLVKLNPIQEVIKILKAREEKKEAVCFPWGEVEDVIIESESVEPIHPREDIQDDSPPEQIDFVIVGSNYKPPDKKRERESSARILFYCGQDEMAEGNLQEARENFNKALNQFLELDLKEDVQMVLDGIRELDDIEYNNLVKLNNDGGEPFDDALVDFTYKNADVDFSREAWKLVEQGRDEMDAGNFERAKSLFYKALERFIELELDDDVELVLKDIQMLEEETLIERSRQHIHIQNKAMNQRGQFSRSYLMFS